MFRFAKLALAALLLTACASTPPRAPKVPSPEELAAPNLELQAPILYGIVLSEIAIQRGGVAAAVPVYLELGQRTKDPRLARRALELAMQTGNFVIAEEALALWESLMPDSQEARHYRVLSLWKQSDLSEALPASEAFLREADAAQRAHFFLHLAPVLRRQADLAAAQHAVAQMTASFLEEKEARLLRAAMADALSDAEALEAELAVLAKIAPKWDLPVLWQLDALQKESPEAALAYIQKELKRRPTANSSLHLALARLFVATQQYEAARQAFQNVLKKEPHHVDANYAMGILSFQLKDYQVAEEALKKALQGGYADADLIRLTLGHLAEEQKKIEDAKQWYQKVGKGRHYVRAQIRLAHIESENHELARALVRLDDLSRDLNRDVELLLMQAQLARNAEHYQKAHQILSAGIKRWKREASLYYERALIADQLNRVKEAERDLRTYLRLKPKDARGCNALGYLFADRKIKLKEAQRLVECALKEEPNNAMYLDSYAWVFYRQGKIKRALPLLEKAYKSFPDPEIAAHLGEVYWQLGQREEAQKIWQEAFKESPKHTVLKATLERFKQDIKLWEKQLPMDKK